MEPAAALETPTPAAPPAGPRRPLQRWLLAAWPALVVALGFLVLIGITVHRVKAIEGGHYTYTIDDDYFHMALAKNLLRHGLWGISALDGFSSGASSLLWPLMITAAFAVFGIHEYIPLVLNVLLGVGLILYTGWIARRTTGPGWLSLLIPAAVTFLMPLAAVVSTGMEHTLQTLLAVVFVDLAARLLTADEQRLDTAGARAALCAVGTLMVMTRYEALFLVAPVGLLLLCRGRWLLAVLLGMAATAPAIGFGFIAVSKGWFFLPNSLLLKGNVGIVLTPAGLLAYFSKWSSAARDNPHMFGLLAANTAALAGSIQRRRTLWSYPALFLFITVVAMLQHLQFAALGWFYRYEAYLIALGVLGLGIFLGYEHTPDDRRYWRSLRALPACFALGLAALLFGAPLWTRAAYSVGHIVTGSYSVYRQQYQMGRFVRRFYDHKGVAANDVGAISFLGECRILDLVGLSDINVLRARRANAWNAEAVERLCTQRRVEMAVIYDAWVSLYNGQPAGWVRVGRWTIPGNTIAASDTVSFYAPNFAFVSPLIQHLQEFSASLPKDVVEDGVYRGMHPALVTGSYGPERDGASTTYWSGSWTQIALYPAPGVPLGSDGTSLALDVFSIVPGVKFDVYFNDQLVDTESLAPECPPAWLTFHVKAKWRGDVNTLRVVGHGTPVVPPGDPRALLFRTREPSEHPENAGQVLPATP